MGWWPWCCGCEGECLTIKDYFNDSSINAGWSQVAGTWTEADAKISTASATATLGWTGAGGVVYSELICRVKASAAATRAGVQDGTNTVLIEFGAAGKLVVNGVEVCDITAPVGTWVTLRYRQDWFSDNGSVYYYNAWVFVDDVETYTIPGTSGAHGGGSSLQRLRVEDNTGTVDFELAEFYENYKPTPDEVDCPHEIPCSWPIGATEMPSQIQLVLDNYVDGGVPTCLTCTGCGGALAGTYLLPRDDTFSIGSDTTFDDTCGVSFPGTFAGSCGCYFLDLANSSDCPEYLVVQIANNLSGGVNVRIYFITGPLSLCIPLGAGQWIYTATIDVTDFCGNTLTGTLNAFSFCTGTYDIELTAA